MRRAHAEQAAIIDARPEEVYAVLADYRGAHPDILPTKYFSDLTVEAGGTGAGTLFRVRTHVLGTERNLHMAVSEPDPGRVLVEADMLSDLATTFTITPENDGARARVAIETDWAVQPGVAGLLEKWLTPPLMRNIYRAQLRQLNEVLQRRRGE